jgi:glycosyltransferase involved in cell wall biosynthesis
MRLLLVNYEYPPLGGGGAVGSALIAEALAARGHQVTVLTSGHRDRAVTTNVENGVCVIRVPVLGRALRSSASLLSMVSFNLQAPLYVWKQRETLQPDLINTHFAIPSGPAGVAIARLLKRPHIMTLIGGELYQQPLETTGYRNPLIPLIVRSVCHAAARLTAISHDTRRGAHQFARVHKPIEVLPYAFAPPDGVPSPQPKQAPPQTFHIVSAGRLVPRKGHNILIRALSHLSDLDWELRILGDGPDKDALESLAESLGIGDRVTLLGFLPRTDFWAEFSRSDLFALATFHEGLGLVYHEAMYCGLPVVTTNNGGHLDFLSEPRNALLVPVGDVGAFTGALRRAMTDRTWFVEASGNNLTDVRALYVDVIVRDWERFFLEALSDDVRE